MVKDIQFSELLTTYNHYLNNSLAKIKGSADLLQKITDNDSEFDIKKLQKYLQLISSGCEEISDLLVSLNDMDKFTREEFTLNQYYYKKKDRLT